LSRLARASKRLRDLVDSMLEYVRIETGEVQTHAECFDLSQVVHDLVEQCRPEAQVKLLKLELSAPEALLEMHSDPRLLRVTLLNLLTNAIKFTERGAVRVGVTREDGWV